MPRIPTSLLRCARQINQLLPLLLRTCRDLRSARNELRWLQEHAVAITSKPSNSALLSTSWRPYLYRLCVERARGMPLQYILGNQPFGDLEILCRKGVLIPRSETEAYTIHIANRILESSKLKPPNDRPLSFRVLDLCTGTGCISLLLHGILAKHIPKCEILGIDISRKAIALANQNLHHNVALGHLPQSAKKQVRFLHADIFLEDTFQKCQWDLVISNPPYVSPHAFNETTSRSVRNYEPRIALVPLRGGTIRTDSTAAETDSIGDAFYPRLLDIAERSNASLLLVEVADLEQARRVVTHAVRRRCWNKFEIWRDWPDMKIMSKVLINGTTIDIIGEGSGRSILIS